MEFHLKLVGCILIGLACLHLIFPRYFNWKEELAKISLVNKQVMEVHTFFIGIMVLLMGFLCLSTTAEEFQSPLGSRLLLGLFLFWLLRLVIQFVWYSPKLWKGRPFETLMHVLFTALWLYFTLVFFSAWRASFH